MDYLVGHKIWISIFICVSGIAFFIISLFIKPKPKNSLAQKFFSPLFQSILMISLFALIFIVGYKISNYKNQNAAIIPNKPIFSGMDF